MGTSDLSIFSSLTPNNSYSESNPEIPSYLLSADNHNLGNSKSSWFSDIAAAARNMPDFAKVSVLSGINSFYNTGVKIGNFFGAQAKERETDAWISSIDSNLGAYYSENAGAADLTGFILGSLIPGVAGVKVLNAGQRALAAANSGLVGSNLGFALGLRSTLLDSYISAAGKEIASGQTLFSSFGASGVKALTTGVYQNVLEGLAFETAVQTTMQASPILSGQDKTDILFNLGVGALFGGALGGAIQSAQTIGKIKGAVISAAKPIQEQAARELVQELNTPSHRIIRYAHNLETGPTINPGSETYLAEVEALTQRQSRLKLDMRAETGKLVPGGDNTLSRMVADVNVGSSATDVEARMLDAAEITRLRTPTSVEADVLKRQKGLPESGDPTHELQVSYAKLTGENAGDVLHIQGGPPVMNLADIVSETSNKSSREAVTSLVKEAGFSTSKLWDPVKLSLTDSSGHLEAEKRFLWASNSKLLREIKPGLVIHQNDIPLLSRALSDGQLNIRIVDSAGGVLENGFPSTQALEQYIRAAQTDVARQLQEKALSSGKAFGTEDAQSWINEKISKITNIKVSALDGTAVGSADDFNAIKAAQELYENNLYRKGLRPLEEEENDVRYLPSWAKITRRVPDRKIDGIQVDALTWFKTLESMAHQDVSRANAKNLREFYYQLPDSFTTEELLESTPYGTGAGFLSFNNPSYGGPGAKVAQLGSVVQRTSQAAKDSFSHSNEGVVANFAKSPEAVIEWGGVNQKTSRSALQWYRSDEHEGFAELGGQGLFAKKLLFKDGTLLEEFAEYDLAALEEAGLYIPIKNQETWSLLDSHTTQTRTTTVASNERAAAVGKSLSHDPMVFRPIPPNPRDYQWFAFVKDPKVTNQGHTSMIFAENEQRLNALVQKAKEARPDLEIYYKRDTEEFRQARKTYEYDRSMSENYIDSSLKNEGIYSDYFIKTDPQKVVNEFVEHHNRIIDTDVREAVRAQYQPAFDWWEDMAKSYSRIETSKFGGNFEKLQAEGKNPYLSYIKTALNLSRANENPLWYGVNRVLDQAVSKAVAKFHELWPSGATSLTDEQLNVLNGHLQTYGLNTGYYDAATNLLVNTSVPQHVLTRFVRSANAILSRLTLGLDPLNALNNAIGSNILRGTELTQITDAIKAGDKELAGKLASLAQVDITGAGDLILSPAKLIASSFKRYTQIFLSDGDTNTYAKALREFYKSNGFIRDISDQFRSMTQDLTFVGNETESVLSTKIKSALAKSNKLAEVGEKLTGNKIAEEMNRFVSADVMKQLTDLAVERGLMTSREQLTYINTFVNRVEGNVIASQRPFVFQGPIGQAIGLFQSYQFNLMQQMFRYVAEGTKKDAAMLLGLQGTFFGIQGLPAFQAINQHIIGNSSGNQKHVDAYDAAYGILGKQAGDLLVYGLPSNLLQTNLYSRGDINPRQLTIIPTALNEVPVIGATMKFFGSLKDTVNKVGAGGAVWESLLQGIEHNGISRPLAGLAQTLQTTTLGKPYSTSQKGDILFSNDLFSIATLSRLAGGRPLDEAIVNDGVFRIHSYQQTNLAKSQILAAAVKSQAIAGGQVPESAWETFASKYAEAGGKQVNFNKFMMQEIRAANTSQSEKIIRQLQNPFAQKVQILMGPDLSAIHQLSISQ